ncbi:MAG: WecB/TagA/CpsF family glycosyltransferase [Oscillospiraceae bacterium]|nr:WecB/TagA/CpsF family glycosyltransferase [Oscillospiraceae bacterium]
MRIDVLGTGFDDTTRDAAVEESLSLISSGGRGYIVTPNPEIVMLCRKNEALSRAIENAFLVLPDGVGVVIGARILGRPLRGRVPGIEYGEALLERCAERGYSVFFLGAKPGVAELAAERLLEKYPALNVVGTNDGYFKDVSPVLERINELSPDVLFVCLGAPAQELWMAEHVQSLNVRLAVGLGGSLDVFSGTVERAPEGFRKLGLEWLYRLLKEPRRTGRMLRLPVFLILVVLRRVFHGGR